MELTIRNEKVANRIPSYFAIWAQGCLGPKEVCQTSSRQYRYNLFVIYKRIFTVYVKCTSTEHICSRIPNQERGKRGRQIGSDHWEGEGGWNGAREEKRGSSLIFIYTVKKVIAIFPSPAGMSLTKLSLEGNNLIIPGPGELGGSVTSRRLGTGKSRVRLRSWCMSLISAGEVARGWGTAGWERGQTARGAGHCACEQVNAAHTNYNQFTFSLKVPSGQIGSTWE